MSRDSLPAALATFYAGWATHQDRLLAVIGPLTDDQMQLRPDPAHWAVWQLAANMAGARAYWFHDVLGEGDSALRTMFRVDTTSVPGLSIDDAGWEDNENGPRTAAEIVDAFQKTWQMMEACLRGWTGDDLLTEYQRPGGQRRTVTRAWVVWHLIEHELQHGTEIAVILRSNGLPTLDL